MTAIGTLINSCRILGNDTATANQIMEETPKGTANGTNTHFRLQYQIIVPGSVYISYGTTFRTQSGFSVDANNGIITFASAPANATALLADYNFQWFKDQDWTEFLSQGSLLIQSSDDPATVADGLIQALEQFSLYYYFMRRATQYAHKYSSTGGQAGQQVDTVTGNFRKLADTAMKMGMQFRTDYYEKQGQQKNPSATVVSMQFDPMTPRR